LRAVRKASDPQTIATKFLQSKLESMVGKAAPYTPETISCWVRALGVVPGVGHAAVSTVASCAITSFLHHIGLGDSLCTDAAVEGVAACSPGYQSLTNFMQCNRLFLQDELKEMLRTQQYVFMANDKGNKGGIDHMPKLWMFWGDGGVVTRTSDCDAASCDTTESTLDILHSAQPLGFGPDGDGGRTAPHGGKITGFSSDSGGGGTGTCAGKSYAEHGLADKNVLVAGCMMHVNNVVLSNPFTELFGGGSITVSNCLQALHSTYDFQKLFREGKFADWRRVWKDAGCKAPAPKRVAEPLLTRWWHATTAAAVVAACADDLTMCAEYVADGHKDTKGTRHIQATKLALDLRQPSILADIGFLAGLGRVYFDTEFLFQQQADSWTQSCGHRAHRQLTRSFIMRSKWDDIPRAAAESASFVEYRKALEGLPPAAAGGRPSQEMKARLVGKFVKESGDLMAKHMLRWRTVNAWFGLGDEKEVARVIAQVLLGQLEVGGASGVVESKVHGTTIDLHAFRTHLEVHGAAARAGYEDSWVSRLYGDAVREMAEAPPAEPVDLEGGIGLSGICTRLREALQTRMMPLLSSTQRVEAAVRESALAAQAANRGEEARSALIAERSYGINSVVLGIKRKWADDEDDQEDQQQESGVSPPKQQKTAPLRPRRPKGRVVATALVKLALEKSLTPKQIAGYRKRAQSASSVQQRQTAAICRQFRMTRRRTS
jgi:hypothetical protein